MTVSRTTGRADIEYREVEAADLRSSICRNILGALPEWFALEVSNRRFAREVADSLFYSACHRDDPVGFIALKRSSDQALAIHVMGVLKEFQRQGIATELIDRAMARCADMGISYLTVKTLGDSHPDPCYAMTRSFYQAVGFIPLEELEGLWDQDNPCLLMIKSVGP